MDKCHLKLKSPRNSRPNHFQNQSDKPSHSKATHSAGWGFGGFESGSLSISPVTTDNPETQCRPTLPEEVPRTHIILHQSASRNHHRPRIWVQSVFGLSEHSRGNRIARRLSDKIDRRFLDCGAKTWRERKTWHGSKRAQQARQHRHSCCPQGANP